MDRQIQLEKVVMQEKWLQISQVSGELLISITENLYWKRMFGIDTTLLHILIMQFFMTVKEIPCDSLVTY